MTNRSYSGDGRSIPGIHQYQAAIRAVRAAATNGYPELAFLELPTSGPDPIIHIFLCAEAESAHIPKTALSLRVDYQAYYLAPQERRPRKLELVPGPAQGETCGFWEVDQQLMPGLYGLQIPSNLRLPGYTHIHFRFAATRPHFLQIHGLGYDPYDSFALGLATWIRSTCHEHLTSGLRNSMPTTVRPLLIDWLDRKLQEFPMGAAHRDK